MPRRQATRSSAAKYSDRTAKRGALSLRRAVLFAGTNERKLVSEAAEQSVSIKCPYCEKQFRAHQRFIRGGSTIECSGCGQEIIFESTSEFASLRKALIAARQLRLKHSRE
jgi:hypothetical protein